MSANKSITESTIPELIERRKKHKFIVQLIDAELSKRNSSKEKKSPKSTSGESSKKSSISYTRDDMKEVLGKRNVEYKSNMSKDELTTLIKKNNLVRIVEDQHRNKTQK